MKTEIALQRTPQSWQVTALDAPVQGDSSLLQAVTTPTGVALLKQDERSGDQVRRTAAMLRRYRGVGSIKLLRKHQNLLLLERADGPSLCSLIDGNQDELATDILTDLVRKLHKSRRAKLPADLLMLHDYMKPLLAQRFSDNPLYRHSARLMYHLLDTSDQQAPLHGALDYDHILHHSERGWLAIAPVGLLGDPHYEFAAALCHMCNRRDFSLLRSRTLAKANRISAATDFSTDRLLTFAFCHACLKMLEAERYNDDLNHWRDLSTTLLDCLASDQQAF